MRRFLGKSSPAMVVACLALFVAMTGTSIAASKYLITSTKQIKPSVIKQLKSAQGPRGLTGPAGAAGATGAAGASGATHVVKRVFVDTTGPWSNYSYVTATCNAGETAIGGGANWISGLGGRPYVSLSSPYPVDYTTNMTGWTVWVFNEAYYDGTASPGSVQAVAFVLCAY